MIKSFASDIAPLFRPADISCMSRMGGALDAYAYMGDPASSDIFPDHANARNVFARLTGALVPQMPKGGPFWPAEQIELFQQWMDDGFAP